MGVIYSSQAKLHRRNITAVDSADPSGISGAVDTKGYRECRFDIAISGTDFQSLEVQTLFWNPRQEQWFGGGTRTFTSTGRHTLVADCRGAIVFLKVTAFSGTSFSLSADYTLN